MKEITNFIGIDISSEYFTVSILRKKIDKLISFENFENSFNGFQSLLKDFQSLEINVDNAVICLEATGVYGESLVCFFVSKGYSVAVEKTKSIFCYFAAVNFITLLGGNVKCPLYFSPYLIPAKLVGNGRRKNI